MPSVHSRPIIESDGNNLALRRVIRFIKRLVVKVVESLKQGSLITEEILDALGVGVVQLVSLLGYPLRYVFSMPEIFETFTGKPLPMTLPLVFVLHIILLVYSTYVLCYMPAVGLGMDSAESISFHLITALAIISYYRGVVTDPGSIPDTAEWEKENIAKKQEGLRFCSREKKYKPERAHYCSAIERNVLKMDHYCPWLANCVGFFNHKFFMLFILYATIATGWTTISTAHLLAVSSAGLLTKAKALSAAQVFFLTEGLCISSLIALILTPFTGFHFWLVARNQTTLEYCEKANAKVSYSGGFFYNFSQIFGKNPLLWFLPVQTVEGPGLSFEKQVHDEFDSEDEEETRVREEMSARVGLTTNVEEPPRHCCIRRWDDSPLLHAETSGWFVRKCLELNDFRETLVTNFGKILRPEDKVEEV